MAERNAVADRAHAPVSVVAAATMTARPAVPLRVAIVVETFARDMGYVSNTLPKYLARLGHDVHIVTSLKLPYFKQGSGDQVFGSAFADRNRNRLGVERIDGYNVHTLESVDTFGYARLKGLDPLLKQLDPDLVCCFVAVGWIALSCAFAAQRYDFALVIGNHTGKTHFPVARKPDGMHWRALAKNALLRRLPGRWISAVAHHCVVPTIDCADIATDFFGVDRAKIVVMNLPVDGDHFHSIANEAERAERRQLRASLGFADSDVVCVYSGKFSAAKNPLVLKRAVAHLVAEGHAVRALFIGAGEQAVDLADDSHSTVVEFQPFGELGRYFRAADIGVWMDESISFLDAASSGLPLVLGETVKDVSHVGEFVARFAADDPVSLAAAILPLLDSAHRQAAGTRAATLAGERFSALRYTERRVALFNAAINRRRLSA